MYGIGLARINAGLLDSTHHGVFPDRCEFKFGERTAPFDMGLMTKAARNKTGADHPIIPMFQIGESLVGLRIKELVRESGFN